MRPWFFFRKGFHVKIRVSHVSFYFRYYLTSGIQSQVYRYEIFKTGARVAVCGRRKVAEIDKICHCIHRIRRDLHTLSRCRIGTPAVKTATCPRVLAHQLQGSRCSPTGVPSRPRFFCPRTASSAEAIACWCGDRSHVHLPSRVEY